MKPKVLHVVNSFLPLTQKWLEILLVNLNRESNIFAKYRNSKSTDQFNLNEFSKSSWVKENLQKPSLLSRLKVKALSLKFSFAKEVDAYARINDYDILHTHFADIACEFLDIEINPDLSYICSFYGWDYEMLPYTRKDYVAKYQKLFKKIDCIITEGPHGKKVLIDKGCDPDKIKVIPLGIELGQLRNSKIKSENSLRLIQIASFREKKGQLDTVKAVRKLIEEGCDIKLTFIGDNGDQSYYDSVMSEIKLYKLMEHIVVRDFIDYDKIEEELTNHDVFLQPSRYASNMDCEGGAPTTLFHALNVGLPIVATDHCDIPFVVINNQTGKIVKEKDIDALAKALKLFYNMGDTEYSTYSKNAIDDVRSRFDITKNAKELESLYSLFINNNANSISTNL